MEAVTITAPAPLESADFPRDRWGRPLIVPAEGGTPIPYVRASSAAKTIEDTYNLELWARRNVAYGMARDASLVARVLAVGGDPASWDQTTRTDVNRIVEDAAQIAQAHKGADIGTAVHRMTELVDRGREIEAGPYEADITAYVNAIAGAGLIVDEAYIECRLVCDELQMAGTADRILVRASDRAHLIADVKTGASVDFGGLGWAAQLAAYSHSSLYDPDSGRRLPTPRLDRTTGIIIHLPAGQGVCTLYEIDLVAGYRAAELANEIRAVRREAKRWIRPHAVTEDRRDTLRARYRALTPGQQETFRALQVPPDDLDVVESALDDIDRGVSAPVTADTPTLARGGDYDEGVNVTPLEVAELRARHDQLPSAVQMWLGSIAAEANRARVPFYLQHNPTERRLNIYTALVIIAENGITDPEQVRALVAQVTDSDAPRHPAVTLGHAVGAMDYATAGAFIDAAVTYVPL